MYGGKVTSLKKLNKPSSSQEPETKKKRGKSSVIINLVEIEYLNNDTCFSNFVGTCSPSGLDITFFIFNNKFFIREVDVPFTVSIPIVRIKINGLESSSVSPNNPFLSDLQEQHLLVTARYNLETRKLSCNNKPHIPAPAASQISSSPGPILPPLSSKPLNPILPPLPIKPFGHILPPLSISTPFSSVDQINPDLDLMDNCPGTPAEKPCLVNSIPIYNLSELPYKSRSILGPQPLMYLSLNIQGRQIKALFDSGASRSFVELERLKLIEDLNLELINRRGRVQVVNSQVELVAREIIAPIELQGHTRSLAIRILKSLPVTFAVGLDFCRIFKLNVDFHDMT